jgi:hypothetical protein
MPPVVRASAFGCRPGSRHDNTPAVLAALERCRLLRSPTLVFPRGSYHFHGSRAVELLCYVSNNDSGCKRVVFPLRGMHGLTIDGQGSQFIFHGSVTPLVLDCCADVTLRDLAMDWHDPQLAQAVVLGSGSGYIDLRMEADYRWVVDDEQLVMLGEGWRSPVRGLLEVDPATGAPAYASGDHCGAPWHSRFRFEQRGKGALRCRNAFRVRPAQGNRVVLTSHERLNPGIFITGSRNVTLSGVSIHHAPAMALIAQRSADISLSDCEVRPAPGSGRLFSASADATHFVNCAGCIDIADCLFEGQLDDATNVHGIYGRVEQRLSATTLLVGLVHTQQKGVSVFGPGDRVALVRRGTLQPYAEALLRSVRRLNADVFEAEVRGRLPGGIRPGDALENLTWAPHLTIRRCVAQKNRARSFLVQTPGRVLIEGNTLSSGGSGIQMGAEAHYWFESGAVRDVNIRNNLFLNCNYGPWGTACIDITPGTTRPTGSERFQRNVRIEGNTFRTFDDAIVEAFNVDGLVFRGNVVVKTDDYKAWGKARQAVHLRSCRNVTIEGNSGPGLC